MPRIAILMAIYEPDMDWLAQQLDSLNAQTYPDLRLCVRDDCSPNTPHEQIVACVQEHITAFPFEISRNERNLGSNATFEKLTAEAEGDYFAYCDQDDIWLADKLAVLLADLEREGAQLVCSDMYVIDAQGKQIADGIAKVRRRQILQSGEGLASGLLTHNFVTGCTMLVRTETAKAAVPFCPYLVHDQYLALSCAARGKIFSEPRPTIRYRLHGRNQTGTFAGVTDKASYCRLRIAGDIQKYEWLSAHPIGGEALRAQIGKHLDWSRARQTYWQTHRGALAVWRARSCDGKITLFELAAAIMPERLFSAVVRRLQK